MQNLSSFALEKVRLPQINVLEIGAEKKLTGISPGKTIQRIARKSSAKIAVFEHVRFLYPNPSLSVTAITSSPKIHN